MRTCEVCGKELQEQQKKYCSQECRRQAMRSREFSRVCEICGETFTVKGYSTFANGFYLGKIIGHKIICKKCYDQIPRPGNTAFQVRCTKCGEYFLINGTAFDSYKKRCKSRGYLANILCSECNRIRRNPIRAKHVISYEGTMNELEKFMASGKMPVKRVYRRREPQWVQQEPPPKPEVTFGKRFNNDGINKLSAEIVTQDETINSMLVQNGNRRQKIG